MSEEQKGFVPDARNCDREPIHIPGSIQPHGLLFVLAEPQLSISQVSDNVSQLLGLQASELLGHSLERVLSPGTIHRIRDALVENTWKDSVSRVSIGQQQYDAVLHRYDGAPVLELERVVVDASAPSYETLRQALRDMQHAHTAQQLCDVAVRHVKLITGFERVMGYSFDEDGHGTVVAEAREPTQEPYLGLHYPASDIPQQARALYLKNWLRNIPDAQYTPVPVVPTLRPDTGKPLDLSLSVLRSVSPVHVEYMKNMGVRASMSVSLIVGGRLWGLISCAHHTGPHFVPHETRAMVETLARLMSLQLAAFEERELAEQREARRATQDALCSAMRASDAGTGVLDSLLQHPEQLLALVNAHGAALVEGDVVCTCGQVPSPHFIGELAAWMHERGETKVASSRAIAHDVPPALTAVAEAEAASASGMVTFALPGRSERRLFWFRPEIVQTVEWGGDPNKATQVDENHTLRPRRSFELWKEEVRLRSLSWSASDLAAVEELRRSALEIDLNRQVLLEQKAVQVRDDLVAVVSHDLRNPLGVIQMQASWLLRAATGADGGEPSGLMRESAERIQRAVDRMNGLIFNLLDLAKIEAGRFELRRKEERTQGVVGDTLIIVGSLADAKRIRITEQVQDVPILADRERLFQVLSNLLGNAIKFTPEEGEILVRAQRQGDDVVFSVVDSGRGIPPDQLAHVFERYWQARRTSHEGTGLGLYIAKGIVEAHGGRIWAESVPGSGAAFHFTLPAEPS